MSYVVHLFVNGSNEWTFIYAICIKFVRLFRIQSIRPFIREGSGRAADRGRDRPVPQGALHSCLQQTCRPFILQ